LAETEAGTSVLVATAWGEGRVGRAVSCCSLGPHCCSERGAVHWGDFPPHRPRLAQPPVSSTRLFWLTGFPCQLAGGNHAGKMGQEEEAMLLMVAGGRRTPLQDHCDSVNRSLRSLGRSPGGQVDIEQEGGGGLLGQQSTWQSAVNVWFGPHIRQS
jgi:hypothetical protein